jgi:hypothetical protein
MSPLVTLILIGAVAGVMSGMFGIGGGAIIVPALILFLGFTQTLANGTSLAALLLPVGVFGCLEYYRGDKLKIWPALMVALGLAGGSWFGAVTALNIAPAALETGYGVFLLYIAWRYISPRKWWREWRGLETQAVLEDADIDSTSRRVLAVSFGIGLVAGLASGMFGIGGGAVIVPALMAILGFDQKLATGTSLGALLLPVGLPGVLEYWQSADSVTASAPEQLAAILPQYGDVALWAAAPLAILLLLGAAFGARITLALPTKAVRRLYGIFLLLVGLRFLIVGLLLMTGGV